MSKMSGEPLHLITTADERTWPISGPVLWLGEWCRLYERRRVWKAFGGELVPYHWRDRERFERDYLYLDDLYERTLASLTIRLNDLHGVRFSARYWRILVGPWLAYFTHILFDRWLSVHAAASQYCVSGTICLPRAAYSVAPNDMSDFLRLIREDEWNSRVYADIIEKTTSIFVSYQCDDVLPTGTEVKPNLRQPGAERKSIKGWAYSVVKRFTHRLARIFDQPTDVFVNTPYVSNWTLVRLFLRLGQFPVLWGGVQAPVVAENQNSRAWIIDQVADTDFEKYLLSSIPRHIPRCWIEGYEVLLQCLPTLPWPSSPKALYTANVLWHDTVAMAYFAEKAEKGAVLVYGQHGGVYGTARFQFAREHESKISDRYLVWGKAGVGAEHEQVVGITKLDTTCHGPFTRHHRLLYVTLNTSRYSYRLCSESARDFLGDLDESFRLIDLLKPEITPHVTIRLSPGELGWNLPQRWRDRFPHIRLDPGYKYIYKLMRTSRLIVFGYNQTGFLESVAMNIPCVLVNNLESYPVKNEALPYYERLIAAGVCHANSQSAAEHINNVWSRIDDWWFSPDVQSVLDQFRYQYCDLKKSLEKRLANQLVPMPRRTGFA